jgi:hypothetical protein
MGPKPAQEPTPPNDLYNIYGDTAPIGTPLSIDAPGLAEGPPRGCHTL